MPAACTVELEPRRLKSPLPKMESVAQDFDSGEGLKDNSASSEKERDSTAQESDRRCVNLI